MWFRSSIVIILSNWADRLVQTVLDPEGAVRSGSALFAILPSPFGHIPI